MRTDALIGPARRKGRAISHVERGSQKSTSQISQPHRAPVRNPPAAAGLGLDPASHLRPAAVLPARGVAPVPPRYEPCIRARLPARPRRIPEAASGETRPARVRLGLYP